MVKAKLVVVGGDAKAAEVQLKLPTIIGRGKEAGLTVPHALVSRRHSEIFERDGRLFVKDLGSLNGTFVNNLRIEDEQPLDPNQLLTLGNVTFRAVYEIQSTDGALGSDSESVSFAQLETTTVEPMREPQAAFVENSTRENSEPAEPQIAFDETVPLDSMPEHDSVDSSRQAPVGPEHETIQATDQNDNSDSETASEDSAADTDKSFKTTYESESPSNIFAFEDEKSSAEKSVSVSALDGLPAGQPAISFVASVEVGDDQEKPVSQIDPVELDLGSDGQKSNVDVDSSLGSFLKKLPR